MKTYFGSRTASGRALVIVKGEDGKPYNLSINPSERLWSHSIEFEWGYGGSGPAQLALALLLDCTTDKQIALALHQGFKRDVVATLPDNDWKITTEEINNWIADQQKRQVTEDIGHDKIPKD